MDFKEIPQHLLNTKSFLGIFLVFSSVYILFSVLYNVFFHPLSKFPGPLWARTTRIPYWIASMKGDQVFFMHRLHEEYGPVVRFSPNELSYTDGRAWRDICGYTKGRSENLKAVEFHTPPQNGTHYILTVDTADHARTRRLFSPAFSDRYLKQHEPDFRRYVDLLMTRLHETEGRPVDMTEKFNLTTFDIISDFIFGEPLGLLENNKYSSWLKLTFDSVRVLPFVQVIEYYPWLSKVFKLVEPRHVKEMKASHFRYSTDKVDQRLKREPDQPDLWSYVMSAAPGNGLTLNEMHINAEFLIMAGAETTGTLLSGVLYLLLQNHTKLERLNNEVREQAAAVGKLSLENLAGLKYLNACIQEALRIYPPVPVGVPRVVSPDNGGQIICGKWVPSGTRVCVHHYATYWSSMNFKNPDLFSPERWLGENDTYRDDRRDAFQPFSFGPRNCVGQNMAWHEMRLVLGSLVSTFDIELCEESRRWMDQKVYALWEKRPLIVRLTPMAGRETTTST
ncbi:Versicolorin B desaturase [Cytospora mali]|uniref:Versicolorin B desaturase n=1 Tax=Cytospora mali TaxID=578113 RepID=A0A194V3R6_CYTMA|nr:Versicolorin B desaturase [Valsa mali var. pyri (nom. inval.)]